MIVVSDELVVGYTEVIVYILLFVCFFAENKLYFKNDGCGTVAQVRMAGIVIFHFIA